jgi:hypothetical protein
VPDFSTFRDPDPGPLDERIAGSNARLLIRRIADAVIMELDYRLSSPRRPTRTMRIVSSDE